MAGRPPVTEQDEAPASPDDTDPYYRLPAAIRVAISRREYQFMTDSQKARLIDDETEPEY